MSDTTHYIAIDGGGSGTRIGLYDAEGALLNSQTGAACNPHEISLASAADFLAALVSGLAPGPPAFVTVLAGISGARDPAVREAIARAICDRLPHVERVIVTTDVHAHLIGNLGGRAGMVVVAGTGSSVAALDAAGTPWLFGGRGPILGDDGSAYDLVVTALREAHREWDRSGEQSLLLKRLAAAAQCAAPADLVAWCAARAKRKIAALAPVVLDCAEAGDELATACVHRCVGALADVAAGAVVRAQLSVRAPIYLVGQLFSGSLYYRMAFTQALRDREIENEAELAPHTGDRAVFELSRHLPMPETIPHSAVTPLSAAMSALHAGEHGVGTGVPLDALSAEAIVERMHMADIMAATAVESCSDVLAALIKQVVRAFRSGGRLIYIGAGTSGRIGVLDASECPPTFGVSAGQVIGIIAGGDRALRESIEGAEDDVDAGRADIDRVSPGISSADVVVGIAASGTTPYTLAGLARAKERGAKTALVCCNAPADRNVDYLLVLPTGPEELPGSTRLKAGTATKMVLNTLTTGAMALSGRVFEGYMVHVQPTNAKLRKRAVRIISVLTNIDESRAAQRLDDARNNVAAAVLMGRLNISAEKALELLQSCRGDIAGAIALHRESNR